MKKLALTLSFVSGCIATWAQLPVQSPATTSSAPSDSGTRRRSSLFLAQIPQNRPVAQPGSGAIPGQNPNTIRPNIPRPAVAPVPRPGTAGSPARPQQPGVTPAPGQQPTPPPQPAIGRSAPPPPPQNQPDAAPDTSGEELIDIQWVQFPMSQILLEYEKLTGKKIVRDINVESVSFTIETTGQLPKSQAIEYIEKSLLLNGYAFVPAGDGMLKFLNVAALKPGSEGTDIFNDPDDLPNDERIVTFVQPLQFLEAEDLKKSITELVPAHAYQVITALPNARGVIITDNSATIRYMLKLIEHLDVEPSRTDKRSFQLLRSSADKVAEALNEILDIESKKSGSSGGSSGGTRTTPPPPVPAATPAANGIPQQNAAAQAQARTPTPAAAGGNAPQAAAIPPKIIPIARTNKLLVIARPIDLAYIETLIEELDGASDVRNFISRPMKYMLATAALPVIEHAITRGMDDEGGGGTSSGGNNSTLGSNNSSTNNSNNRSGDFSNGRSGGFGNNSGFGGGGFGNSSGMGGGSSFGGGGGLSSLGGDNMEPKSTVIGKTLIIADPNVNEIFASGPPDQLEALNQVLEQIDRRPRQVVIDAVIGELNVNDNKDFGIDYIMRPRGFGQGNNYGSVAGVARNDIVGDLLVDPSSLTALDDFPNPSGLALFGTLNDDLNFAVKALASTSNFKILSRPTLHTINNKPASIETGLKIPIPTSTLGSFNGGVSDPGVGGGVNSGFVSNIAYQDVSLRLDVAPLIYSDDELLLEVKQVNASTNGTTTISGNPIPNISNQGLQTTVTVKNNATVLLGGLISETTDRQRNGIPILKDLPIIKYLTSSTKNFKKRNELLIFIRPRIVKGEGDVPTSPQDPSGASPLGGDMRKFLNNEYVDPEQERSQVKRSRAARLFQKLFQ